ncbi:hypothetical protein LUZ60_006283 [Juncus effusus]|nr:hypothetical protein LUZ60_006283 [Juncus effusus]
MASSKLVHLSSAFLRSYRRTSLSSSSHLLFPIPTFSPLAKSQPSLRFCTAVDSAPAVVEEQREVTVTGHPWPEWDGFLEKLKSKGYFEKSTSGTGEDGAVSVSKEVDFTDTNTVKNACLKFARERYDILSSLPEKDMKAIVETGCPNLFRKFINSSKRLRAFLHIVEADACGVCKLRGSCDKAYLESRGEESARTVDIIRIILAFALEPNNLSENENNNVVNDNIQESARNLLTEIIKLSDMAIDPNIPKPVFDNAPKMRREKEGRFNKERERRGSSSLSSVGVEMKKGDWMCPKCDILNFARNMRCFKCNENGPKTVENNVEMKPGDWTCPKCEFLNFSRNRECFRCEEPHQRELNFGEWECPECNYVNFRRNTACRKCNCERPEGTGDVQSDGTGRVQFEKPRHQLERNLGEWDCPKCNYVNFKRNVVCRKCDCERPGTGDLQFEGNRARTGGDQLEGRLWQSPKRNNNRRNSIKFEDESDGAFEDDEGNGDDGIGNSRFEGYRKLSTGKRDPSSRMQPSHARE